MPLKAMREFLKLESASGILLFLATVLALCFENSPLFILYDALLDTPVTVQIGALIIAKPFVLWVNDGLMAVFFLLVGMELKREFFEGQLAKPSQIILPAAAALGGMAVPALFYFLSASSDPDALRGWAIPAATDIAFALGVLSLLGSRVPLTLKIFLTALAVFDDLGAIIIIAFFYTESLSLLSLGGAAIFLLILVLFNHRQITNKGAYFVFGLALWVCVLKSGVHATLAGVLIGLLIPMRDKTNSHSPLKTLEHEIHPWVAFVVLPIFAFCNAGVNFSNITPQSFLEPVALGTFLGLFFGKQIGIVSFCVLAVKLRLCQLPQEFTWSMIYGVSCLAGIGFTMSLFIGGLAFDDPALIRQSRVGILAGSLLAGGLGVAVLSLCLKKKQFTLLKE